MNKQMIEFYNALLDQKDLSEEAVDEALTTGIIADDCDLVKKAFGKITEDMVCSVDNSYMDFAIRKMASVDVLSLLKNGYTDPSPMPAIFAGYPEDMISFYESWKRLNRLEALNALCVEVDYYLGVMKNDFSCYRIQFAIYDNDEYKPYFFSYIDEWVTRFLKIVKNEIKDKERLKHFIKKVLIHPELCKSMDYVFSEFSSKFLDDSWLINGAIISDNLKATDALLKIASEKTLKSISVYPRSNTKILDLLFSNNVLLPGSSKGFNAFCDYIFHDEPNEKILKQIISPSYLEKKYGDYHKQIPLMLAASNENFPLYLYSDLILSPATLSIKDNKGNNILLLLATSYNNYFDSMNHLIKLGADPFVTDKNGNNVLHLLLQNKFFDFYSIQDYCSFLPTELLEMKNVVGETPLEMFANEIKQKFSPKDKVNYSKINNFLFDEDSIGDGKNKNILITGSDDDVRNAVFMAIKEHQETLHKRNISFCQTYYDYDSVTILENLLDVDEKTAVYISELADLLYTDFGKDIERLLSKLAQKRNIFIIASTSRASAEIITRTIKEVFPIRLSSRLSSEMSSKLVFGESGAEELGVNKFMTMNQTNGSIGVTTLMK